MSSNNHTSTYVAIAAVAGVGLLFMFGQQPKKKNPFLYDPQILFTNAMRQGTDIEGAKQYWINRFRDPTYVKGEAMHYSPEVIKADKAWQDRYRNQK